MGVGGVWYAASPAFTAAFASVLPVACLISAVHPVGAAELPTASPALVLPCLAPVQQNFACKHIPVSNAPLYT